MLPTVKYGSRTILKAMDQPDHVTRFLPYQHFSFV